jgi:hypothetical protein
MGLWCYSRYMHFISLLSALLLTTTYAAAPEIPLCSSPMRTTMPSFTTDIPNGWEARTEGAWIMSLQASGGGSIDFGAISGASGQALKKGDFTPVDMAWFLPQKALLYGARIIVTGTGTTTLGGQDAYRITYTTSSGSYHRASEMIWIKNPWKYFQIELESPTKSFESDRKALEIVRKSLKLESKDRYGDSTFCMLFPPNSLWSELVLNDGYGGGFKRDRVGNFISIGSFGDAEGASQIDVLRGKIRGKNINTESLEKKIRSKKWLRESRISVSTGGSRFYNNTKYAGTTTTDVRFKIVGSWIYAVLLTEKNPEQFPDEMLDILMKTMQFDPNIE